MNEKKKNEVVACARVKFLRASHCHLADGTFRTVAKGEVVDVSVSTAAHLVHNEIAEAVRI